MNTPLHDSLVGEVLKSVHVARERLATTRTGIDRLHSPDEHERCPTCREAWPCATRRLVDGVCRGELDARSGEQLVEEALHREPDEDRPVPHRVPRLADLLEGGRTGKALDILLGGRG